MQWPIKFYDMHVKFNELLKPMFLDFMNKNFAKAPYERRSIKKLYLKDMRLFKYDPNYKKK